MDKTPEEILTDTMKMGRVYKYWEPRFDVLKAMQAYADQQTATLKSENERLMKLLEDINNQFELFKRNNRL